MYSKNFQKIQRDTKPIFSELAIFFRNPLPVLFSQTEIHQTHTLRKIWSRGLRVTSTCAGLGVLLDCMLPVLLDIIMKQLPFCSL